MSDTKQTPIQIVETFVADHKIDEKVQLNDQNRIEIPSDIWESVVLKDSGVSKEQFNDIHEKSGLLTSAVSYVAAKKTAEAMKTNEDLVEVGFQFNSGFGNVTGVIPRSGQPTIISEVTYNSNTMNAVMESCKNLFDSVNS